MSLAGDGVNDELFFLLWSKDEPFKDSVRVHIPDTVIYKVGSPVAWYFSSATTGKILKKNKHNLLSVRIEEHFNKQVAASDIVAYYLSLPNVFAEEEEEEEERERAAAGKQNPKTAKNPKKKKAAAATPTTPDDPDAANEGGGGGDPRIEYFDRAGLHHFLFHRSKDCGILQRFVEPQGPKNAVIRAIWSPKLCIAERRTNVRPIYDQRFGLYERAVTYEGPDHHSKATPLRGNVLATLIQQVCQELVQHIAEVTFQKQRICRCVFNFKVDSVGRLFFLWSSSIRLEEGEVIANNGGTTASSGGSGRRLNSSSAAATTTTTAAALLPSSPTIPSFPTSSPEQEALLVQRNSLNIHAQLQLPRDLRLVDTASHRPEEQPPRPLMPLECPCCHQKATRECFHGVPYKTVIGLHESRQGQQQQQQQEQQQEKGKDKASAAAAPAPALPPPAAPPLLQALHPELTDLGVYRRCKQDRIFQKKQVLVCEDCYLSHAHFATSVLHFLPARQAPSSSVAAKGRSKR